MKNICLLTTVCLFFTLLVSCGYKIDSADFENDLAWSSISPNDISWFEAVEYCYNLTEREKSDWRLPTIDELRNLIQSCQETIPGGSCAVSETCAGGYCLDESCQACSPELNGSYSKLGDTNQLWSATSLSNHDPAAWYVDFSNAGIYLDEKENYRYARCVRK